MTSMSDEAGSRGEPPQPGMKWKFDKRSSKGGYWFMPGKRKGDTGALNADGGPKKRGRLSTGHAGPSSDVAYSSGSFLAIRGDADAAWMCEVTEDVATGQEHIRVQWLKEMQHGVFEVGTPDEVDMSRVLCEIQLLELEPGKFYLSSKTRAQVDECLRETPPVETAPEEEGEEDDDGQDRDQAPKKRAKLAANPPKKQAAVKKLEPLSNDPFWDSGELPLRSVVDQVQVLRDKLAIRAVRLGDAAGLAELAADLRGVSSLHRPALHGRSITALKLALLHDKPALADAILMEPEVLKAAAAETPPRERVCCPAPSLQAMSSGSVGWHAYRAHVRSVKLSRGGKEGNQAFVKDLNPNGGYGKPQRSHIQEELQWLLLRRTPLASIQRLHAAHLKESDSVNHALYRSFGVACRSGERATASFIAEMALKTDAWGLNAMHAAVLRPLDAETAGGPDGPFGKQKAQSFLKKADENFRVMPVHAAAINPDPKVLRAVAQALGGTINEAHTDDDGRTVLHYAAACESPENVCFLLDEAKHPVDAKSDYGTTPLMVACTLGRLDCAKLLLERGADPFLSDSQVKSMPTKLRRGRRPPPPPPAGDAGLDSAHLAVEHERLDCLQLLLEKGVNANTADKLERRTLLHRACFQGSTEAALLLLEARANVSSRDKLKRTPLIMAAMGGSTKLCSHLLVCQAKVDDVDSSGNSALHYAAGYGWVHVVQYLVQQAGASLVSNSWKCSPVFVALLKSHFGIVDWLARHAQDLDPEQTDGEGRTLLALACAASDPRWAAVLRVLLERGACVNSRDVKGRSPLHHLALTDGGHDPQSLVETLHKAKAELNSLDEDGCSPLLLAIQNKKMPLVQELLCLRADPAVQGKQGMNLLHMMVTKAVERRVCHEEGVWRFAISDCRPGLLRALAEASNPRQLASMAEAADDAGNTPLHLLTSEFEEDFKSFVSYVCLGPQLAPDRLEEFRRQRREAFFSFLDAYLTTTGTRADLPMAAPQPKEPAAEAAALQRTRPRPQLSGRPPVPLCPSSGEPMHWVPGVAPNSCKLKCLASGKAISGDGGGHFQGKGKKDAFGLAALGTAGKTALHMLAELGDLAAVSSLLERIQGSTGERGAALSVDGNSALSQALASTSSNRYGLLEGTVSALVSASDQMTLNACSLSGESVLHKVVGLYKGAVQSATQPQTGSLFRRQPEPTKLEPLALVRMAKVLLAARANPAQVDVCGRAPLLCACSERATDLIQALLEARSDPALADAAKRTALHYLMDSSRGEESFELERSVLTAAGGEKPSLLNARDKHGRTALHYAFVKFADDAGEGIKAESMKHSIELGYDEDGAYVSEVKDDRARQQGVCVGHRLLKIDNVEVTRMPKNDIMLAWRRHGSSGWVTLGQSGVQTLLHCGTNACDPVEAVTSLCVEDLDVDVKDVYCVTPLLYAASRGATISTLCLIKRQADLHASDARGHNALARALLADHSDYAIMLLQKGLSPEGRLQLPSKHGLVWKSYFWRAMEKGYFGVAYLLLEEGFPLFKALQDALDIGKAELAYTLLQKVRNDAVVSGRVPETGDSLLHVLCRAPLERCGADGGRRLAEGLCARGAPAAAANGAGEVPLHLAAASLSEPLLAWLLAREPGAAKRLDAAGRAPLHRALLPEAGSQDQKLASLRILGEATGPELVSACVGGSDADGGAKTLLVAAVGRRQEELAQLLLETYAADVNVPDKDGITPLMWGVKVNAAATVGRLLQARSDVSTVDAFGRNVLHHCVQPLPHGSFENEALLSMLCQARAALDAQDKAGKTPLAMAYGQDSGRMARVLKGAGAKKPGDPSRFSRAKSAILTWSGPTEDFEADSAAAVAALGEVAAAKRELPVHKCYGMEGQNKVAVLDGEPYDVLMVKVDIKKGEYGENNFYHMQLVHESARDLYVIFTRWGRIGETGMFQRTPQESLEQAKKEWAKIFKSKSGNEWERRDDFEKKPKRYSLLSVEHAGVKRADLLKPFHDPPVVQCTLPPALQRTLKAITSLKIMQGVMTRHDINMDAMPFGCLSRESLLQGLAILKSIGDQIDVVSDLRKQPGVDGAALTEAKERLLDLSSDYYTLVPKAKFANEAVQPIRTERQLNEEWGMLQDLLDMEVAAKVLLAAKSREQEVHPLDYVCRALGVQMDQVAWDSEEQKLLSTYLSNTSDGAQHRTSAIYRLQRRGEAARMASKCQGLGQHKLLWHGTPTSNLVGILAQGLRVAPPEAPASGYAFGKGIYFADMACKSLGYCRAGGSEPKYLLLAEVALGEPFQTRVATYLEAPMPGTNSTMAVGKRGPDWESECLTMSNSVQIPLGKPVQMSDKEAGGDKSQDLPPVSLQNREYVVYDAAQVRLRYLVEINNGAPTAEEGNDGEDNGENAEDDEDGQSSEDEEEDDV